MSPGLADTALNGLAAQSQPGASVLILGSMPGMVSLAQQRYYAHPRNLFWPIMATLCGFAADLGYLDKLQRLNASGVALWDVIGQCQRKGSLDSAIYDEQVNNFEQFFTLQPGIAAIGFNGAKAWQSFQRYVLPSQQISTDIALLPLPSTSPAHAALSFEQKLAQWQQLIPFIARHG